MECRAYIVLGILHGLYKPVYSAGPVRPYVEWRTYTVFCIVKGLSALCLVQGLQSHVYSGDPLYPCVYSTARTALHIVQGL